MKTCPVCGVDFDGKESWCAECIVCDQDYREYIANGSRIKKHVYAGADWIADTIGPDMSPLGIKVADILGAAFRGIYHLRFSTLKRINWKEENNIIFHISWPLSTYDGNELTTLVILAHEACVRLEITPASPTQIRFIMSCRDPDAKSISKRHPMIGEAIESAKRLMRE